MSAPIHILLIEDNPGDARLVQEFLREAPEEFKVETASTLVRALDLLSRSNFDLALVDLGLPDSQGTQTFATLRAHAPDLAIMLLTGNDDDAVAAYAVQNGAQDYLVKGNMDPTRLSRSIRHALLRHQREAERAPARQAARVIGVLGARGGVGVTTVSCYLSAELARLEDSRVLLADLDERGGSVGFLFRPKRHDSLLRVLMNLQRLDRAFWDTAVAPVSDQLHLLESGDGLPQGADTAAVRVAIRFAKPLYSWIVLDLGRPDALSAGLLEECTDVLFVTTPSISVMHSAKRLAPHLVRTANLKLLVTQDRDNAELSLKSIQELFGIPDSRRLPTIDRELHEAWTNGRILAESSSYRRELARLALELTGQKLPEDTSSNPLSRLLSFVSGSLS